MPLKILTKHVFHSCIIFHNKEVSHVNQSINCWALKSFHFFPIIDNSVKSIFILFVQKCIIIHRRFSWKV